MKMLEKINYRNLSAVLFGIFISFILIFHYIYPVDFSNLGGVHSWLSGASLKFVNQWLEEGAVHNHFTCYELFDSIEYQTRDERIPYISYPTGSTFMVFIAAKLLGKNHIGIIFLKKYQLVLYLAEALLLGTFIYVLLTDFAIRERTKILSAYFTTLTWIILPVNVWYLANIYFTDQAVIFYILFFLLLEYISGRNVSARQKKLALILKVLVSYAGVMTDYYFWILIFVSFICYLFRCLILKHSLKDMVFHAIWYAGPVAAALLTFFWQLSFTNNWQDILMERFFYRAGDLEDGNVWDMVFYNFYVTLADFSIGRGVLLCCLEVFMVILLVWYCKKKGNWRDLFVRNEYSILLAGFSAPVLQIIVLKQHSAIHEFSMIKIGWVLVMSVLVYALLLSRLTEPVRVCVGDKRIRNFEWIYIAVLTVMLSAMGSPFNAKKFLDRSYAEATYSLEQILYETAGYEDVYFSFTYSIPYIPPQQLAVSEKQVYQISDINEIDGIFPALPVNANKMLIIDKKLEGKDPVVAETESQLLTENAISYEDDDYCILKLNASDESEKE